MGNIHVVNPYNKTGGGKVSQIALNKALDTTRLFNEVKIYDFKNKKHNITLLFEILIFLNKEKNINDFFLLQGIFEIEYLLVDLLLFNKKRLIIIPRGAFVPRFPDFEFVKKPLLKLLLWKVFIKNRFKKAGCWVATSDFELNRFLVLGANKKNNFIIPDSYNQNRFKCSVTELHNEFKFKDYILFVGRISKEKNLLFIIELMNELVKNGFKKKMILVGPISDRKYFNKIQGSISKYSLKNFVIFREAKTDDELQKYYFNAYCVLLPSFVESFGLVILEAIEFSKMIFVSNNVPLKFISPDYGKELELNVQLWRDELINFQNNSIFDLKISKEIFDKFSIENVSSLWRKAIKNLIDEC